MELMKSSWLVQFQQICLSKCKDIFVVEKWGAIIVLTNNIVTRQRGME